MTFYAFIELAASLIESVLIISTITQIGGKKFSGIKQLIWISGLSGVLTGIVTYMNSLAAFSFVTITIVVIYAICVTKFTSTGGFLLRALACILTLFFLHTFDYIIGFSSGLIFGDSNDIYHGFELMMRPGTTRVIYTVINKSLQILAFILLRPMYRNIRSLSKRYQRILLVIATSCYVIMSILLHQIMEESLLVMQISIIFSWLFIMLCLIAFIVVSVLSTNYQKEKQEKEMIALANELIEKNYLQLNTNQQIAANHLHDYINHLKTLAGMVQSESEAGKYLHELLAVPYKKGKLSHSGNEVVDAILNCKMAEALAMHISFSMDIRLPKELNIASMDICAVLSNQIDNAFEACTKISDEKERIVNIVLWQKEDFLFFKVTNSVIDNPFIDGNKLVSTKKERGHGIGLLSINHTVEKYEGTLENHCNGNKFVSIAMMQNTTRDE